MIDQTYCGTVASSWKQAFGNSDVNGQVTMGNEQVRGEHRDRWSYSTACGLCELSENWRIRGAGAGIAQRSTECIVLLNFQQGKTSYPEHSKLKGCWFMPGRCGEATCRCQLIECVSNANHVCALLSHSGFSLYNHQICT